MNFFENLAVGIPGEPSELCGAQQIMIAKNQPRLKTLGGNGVKLIIMKR